ncbi:OprD family porin [Pseudomonas sp. KU26590]|uniref:OprD family porin n=1 Tax=Pseudomonas sp. KU26590 TaxID=2991051 RepID=UPI00223D7719|nr:OprD family porin [Pseudomonas sp. KU26590]UZJ60216.1 OprD family porin [Pseudomonas sp. KU26590]
MTHLRKMSLAVFSTLASVTPVAGFAEEQKEGFIDGSTFNVLSRTFYMNRDSRKGQSTATGNGYSEATAQGFIAKFESGFTQGTFGVGVDAFALMGIKLDTGGGRNGFRSSFDVLPVDNDGEAEDEYTKLGGSVKARAFDTVVNVGDVFPSTPVVSFGDSRVLPESFRGVTATNKSISGLTVQGGRLHSMSQPQSTSIRDGFATFYAGPVNSPWIGYFGGDYDATDRLTLGLYGSRLKDAWDQKYAAASYILPLSDQMALTGSVNYYNATDEGKKLLGKFDNDIWSVKVALKYGSHTFALSHQRNQGDDDFDYLRQSDSIYVANSIQYSDFNSPKERSWMATYNLDMSNFGVPGLSFMTRYGKGTDADYSNANSTYMRRDSDGNPLKDQKRWERDIEAKYVVQTGTLKDLSLRLRQATTRATAFESDLDEVRLIVEYPISVL